MPDEIGRHRAEAVLRGFVDLTGLQMAVGVLRGFEDPEVMLLRGEMYLLGLDTQDGPAPSGRVQRVKLAAHVKWRTP